MRFEDFDIDFSSTKGADESKGYEIIESVSIAKYKKTGEKFAIKIMAKPKKMMNGIILKEMNFL